ncbi:MAG: hypothetical protein GXO35_01465 [Gammaproteobacteria bacterium]|nr:hypothetical protein [Gammaproteobacteria bacterium]
MANTITASVLLDFKGESKELSVQFDLDDWVNRSNGEMPDFVSAAAGANDTGLYSYELEAMGAADVSFSRPTGMADRFFDAATKCFDFEGFRKNWLRNVYFGSLSKIHQTHFDSPLIEDSPQHLAMLDVVHLIRKEYN